MNYFITDLLDTYKHKLNRYGKRFITKFIKIYKVTIYLKIAFPVVKMSVIVITIYIIVYIHEIIF